MTTGQRIKTTRKNLGLTQKELAARIGVTYQTLAQWENDLRNPKYETLYRIAKELSVSVSYLQGLDSAIADRNEAYMNGSVLRIVGEQNHQRIAAALEMLNARGQKIAVERVEELTKIPDYQKEKNPADGN